MMTNDDKNRDENLKHDINREEQECSTIIYKNWEIWISYRWRNIILYSPLGKAVEKQTTTIEDHGRKQTDPILHQTKD